MGTGYEQQRLDAPPKWQCCLHRPLSGLERIEISQPPFCDGEMRYDVVVGAAVRRILRKRLPDGGSELAERLTGLGIQPHNVLTEPARGGETAVEGADRRCGSSQGRNDIWGQGGRGHERTQNGDVGRHSPTSCRIKVPTVPVYERIRFGDGRDDRSLRRGRGVPCRRQIAHSAEDIESQNRLLGPALARHVVEKAVAAAGVRSLRILPASMGSADRARPIAPAATPILVPAVAPRTPARALPIGIEPYMICR